MTSIPLSKTGFDKEDDSIDPVASIIQHTQTPSRSRSTSLSPEDQDLSLDSTKLSTHQVKQAAQDSFEIQPADQDLVSKDLQISELDAANGRLIQRAEAAEAAVEVKEAEIAAIAFELDNVKKQIKESVATISRFEKSDEELRTALEENQDDRNALDRRLGEYGRERYAQGMQDAYDEDKKLHAQYDDMVLENERYRTAIKHAEDGKYIAELKAETAEKLKAEIEDRLHHAHGEKAELEAAHQDCISAERLEKVVDEVKQEIAQRKDRELEEALENARLENAQETHNVTELRTLDRELRDSSADEDEEVHESDGDDDQEGEVHGNDTSVTNQARKPEMAHAGIQTETPIQAALALKHGWTQTAKSHTDASTQDNITALDTIRTLQRTSLRDAAAQTEQRRKDAAVQTIGKTRSSASQTDTPTLDAKAHASNLAATARLPEDSPGQYPFASLLLVFVFLCIVLAVLVEVRPGGSTLGIGHGAYGFDGARPGPSGYALRALGAFLNHRQADHITVLLHRHEWLT